jgi:hypothetical protein
MPVAAEKVFHGTIEVVANDSTGDESWAISALGLWGHA